MKRSAFRHTSSKHAHTHTVSSSWHALDNGVRCNEKLRLAYLFISIHPQLVACHWTDGPTMTSDKLLQVLQYKRKLRTTTEVTAPNARHKSIWATDTVRCASVWVCLCVFYRTLFSAHFPMLDFLFARPLKYSTQLMAHEQCERWRKTHFSMKYASNDLTCSSQIHLHSSLAALRLYFSLWNVKSRKTPHRNELRKRTWGIAYIRISVDWQVRK